MMKRKSLFTSVVVASALSWSVSATEPDSTTRQLTPMSLDGCIAYAMAHSPAMARADAALIDAGADYREAIGAFLPSLSAGTDLYYNLGRGLDPGTNTYTDINSLSNSYYVSASLTLFNGLSSVFELRRQRLLRQAKQVSRAEVAYTLKLGVVEAYTHLVYALMAERVAADVARESNDRARLIARMEEIGTKSRPDRLEAEAQAAEANTKLEQARGLCRLEQIRLCARIHYPIEQNILVSTDTIAFDEVQPYHGLPDDVFASAREIHPSVCGLALQERAAQAAVRSSWGAVLPSISLETGFRTNFSRLYNGTPYESFAEQLRHNRGEYVGLSLRIPLFDGFRSPGRIARARSQRILARLDYGDGLRKLYADISQAIVEINTQATTYRQAALAVEANLAAYDAAKRRYEVGLNSALDVSTSANRLFNARLTLLQAGMKYRLAKKQLELFTTDCSDFETQRTNQANQDTHTPQTTNPY